MQRISRPCRRVIGVALMLSLLSWAWLLGRELKVIKSIEEPGYKTISARPYIEHVKFLAGDALKGRGNGTPELDRAAEYIAKEFQKAGLSPGGDAESFFQKFTITTHVNLGPGNQLQIIPGSKDPLDLKLNESYLVLGLPDQNQLTAPIVFAGYGITAPEYQYDDYRNIDVTDKVVLVLDHEPQEMDEHSRFDGKNNTDHATLMRKVFNAKNHGAKALLLIKDVSNHPEERERELSPPHVELGTEYMGLIVLQVKSAAMDSVLALYQTSLPALQKEIDATLTPKSFSLHGARAAIRVDAQRTRKEARNVIGYLRGKGTAPSDEYVILGAHYDHLGLGGRSSLAPQDLGKIHHGADDNASGTAGLLLLAQALSRDRDQLRRNVVFMAFAGEELGLLGSAYYTKNPKFPLEKTVAMINMDMIGRPRNQTIKVGGVGTAALFPELVSEAGQAVGLTVESSVSGYSASDHTSFNMKNIPVLFIFSGLHSDYHKPTDVWERIDAPAAEKVVRMVYLLERALDRVEPRPQYTKVRDDMPPPAGGRGSGSGSGYGPYFGSIPDMSEEVRGVRFADVRENSPAAKAGLRGGDVLTQFDGKKIDNLQDFTYALRSKKPGDEVEVMVTRNGQPVKAKVKLEVRK